MLSVTVSEAVSWFARGLLRRKDTPRNDNYTKM